MNATTLALDVPGARCHGNDEMLWYDRPAEFDEARRRIEALGWRRIDGANRGKRSQPGILEYLYVEPRPVDDSVDLVGHEPAEVRLRLRVAGYGWRWVDSIEAVRELAADELHSFRPVDFSVHHGYYAYTFATNGRRILVLQLALDCSIEEKPRRQLHAFRNGEWVPYGPEVLPHAEASYGVGLHWLDRDLPTVRMEFLRHWSTEHPGVPLPDLQVFLVI